MQRSSEKPELKTDLCDKGGERKNERCRPEVRRQDHGRARTNSRIRMCPCDTSVGDERDNQRADEERQERKAPVNRPSGNLNLNPQGLGARLADIAEVNRDHAPTP